VIAKSLLVAATVFLVATAALADPRQKRHVRHAKVPQAADQMKYGAPGFQRGPARMLEVRPGYYVSSYGCYTDEGYGRYSPCDRNEGGR
jgi:hypothetical protein